MNNGLPKEIYDRIEWKHQSKDAVGVIAPEIRELRHVPGPCDDCGVTLERPRHVSAQTAKQPCHHWSVKCFYCGLHRSPLTGEFTVTNDEKRLELEMLIQQGKKKRCETNKPQKHRKYKLKDK